MASMASVERARIVMTTLGSCSLRADDKAQNGIPCNFYKIAAYILLSGSDRIVSRDAIRQLLWSEQDDRDKAAADLRQTLMRIRRVQDALGFRLIESNLSSVYLVDDPALSWDLAECLAQISSGDYQGRVRYPGDLLADIPYCGAEFEDWLAEQRHFLRSEMLEYLIRAIEDESETGSERRYDHAHDLLRIDPCNEEAYRLLMIRAATNRDFSQLEYLFRKCEKSLERDLGIRVSVETSALHTGLVRTMFAPASRDGSSGLVERRFADRRVAGSLGR